MYSKINIYDYRQKSEKGFVLIAALIAVMVIMAVGFFILTTSTQDIRISARLVGERKALSAAECGAAAIYASPTGLTALVAAPSSGIQCDPANDPSSRYSVTTQKTNQKVTLSGYPAGYTSSVFNTVVTGTDSSYDSSVSIAIGLAPPSTPGETNYGNGGP